MPCLDLDSHNMLSDGDPMRPREPNINQLLPLQVCDMVAAAASVAAA